MAKKKSKVIVEDKDAELLEEAKERFMACLDHYSEEYERGREDVDFVLGEQWPEDIKEQRKKEGRPCLTENRTAVFAHQVINNIRQSRPSISVSPVDSSADPQTADIYKGIIKNIEVQSAADNVYDTAIGASVMAGYGWMRVLTQYADDASFDKEIILTRVPDFSSVMIDPSSMELDGSDAEYGFVYADIDEEKFEAMYPDAEKMDQKSNDFGKDGWCTDEKVRIVEYFYKEYETKTLVQGSDGVAYLSEELPEGVEALSTRTISIPSVKWCKFVGNKVLEKTDFESKYIPLIPVYGEEVWQDGRRKCFSLITQAKDPARRYNYWLTASTEIMALQPKAPFIGISGQFESAQNKWRTSNSTNHAYLEYDPVRLPDGTYVAQPPQRQPVPMGSPAMFQEMVNAADGIKAVLGIFDASLGSRGNETSGKAIIARQQQGDNATFHFIDNLQTSIRHVGRILVDMIPKIYSGKRIVRIIGDDGTKNIAALNQAAVKTPEGDFLPIGPNQKTDAFFDLNNGKYDVVANVGPNYATRRQELANTLQAIMQAAPQTFELFGDIFFKSLDVPEAEVMAERLRKVNPIMRDEEDPQAAELQKAGQLIQAMQQQLAQLDGALKQKREKESVEVQAEVAKTQAEVEKIKAETTKIQAEVAAAMAQASPITPQAVEEIVRTIAMLESTTQDTAQAVDIILSSIEGNQATGQPEQMPAQPDQGEMTNV